MTVPFDAGQPRPARSTTVSGSHATLAAQLPVIAAIITLFGCAFSDALPVSLLRSLTIDRHSVSPALAHAFLYAKIIGMIAGAAAMRTFGPARIGLLPGLAALGGLLLSLNTLPLGFTLMIVLRAAEGAVSICIYHAASSNVLDSTMIRARSQRSTIAAGAIMLGAATGFAIGGQLGPQGALAALWLGAATYCGLALIASIAASFTAMPEPIPMFVERAVVGSASHPMAHTVRLTGLTERLLLVTLLTTVPVFLGTDARWNDAVVGSLLAIATLIALLWLLRAGSCSHGSDPAGERLRAGILLAGVVGGLPLFAATHVLILGAALSAAAIAAASAIAASFRHLPADRAVLHIGSLLLPVGCGVVLLGLIGNVDGQRLAFTMLPSVALLHLAALMLALPFSRTQWDRRRAREMFPIRATANPPHAWSAGWGEG